METAIIQCEQCGAKNRIRPHSDRLRPVCGSCGAPLTQTSTSPRAKTTAQGGRAHIAVSAVLLILIVATVCGISVTPSLLKQDFSDIKQKEAREIDDVRTKYGQELAARRAELEGEVAAINTEALRRSAVVHYDQELAGRRSYDKRFALSPRERAQLHMQNLASDSTASYHDAIRAVAREASPRGADIGIHESSSGITLQIDFDMSSMTSGEHGTRTKHHTKESLHKEVVSLISRVTNDIFQFCNGLKLVSIHVGCRHFVRTHHPYGAVREENRVLYRIRIQKNRVGELTNNPFLDMYSTTRQFEVDEDHFENIEIITNQV